MSQLISQLPAGSKVIESNTKYYNAVIPWIVLEHGHDGASNTTLLAEKILTLKCFDAKEPSNSNSDRKSYGNNRYSVSNIRQWLNSDAAAGGWYSAQHNADAPPNSSNVYNSVNPYDTQVGFLNGFSADFKALLQDVTKIVAKNTVTDDGGSETVTNKIFLLSETEVGLGNENNIAEGTQYTYFNSADSRKCKCTAEAIANSNYSSNPTVNDNWYWWLRTPYASYANRARSVGNDGTLYYNYAYYGSYGVRPACAIPSDTKVSDGPNQDGYYEIVYNQTPTISPAGSNLGELNTPLQQTYTIADADGDAFTGTVILDGTQIQTFSGTASLSLSLSLVSQWSALTLDSHTMVISVTDSASNTTTETYTFTKTAPAVYISGQDADLGRLYEAPTIPYSITESEDPVAWIKESIDGSVTKTILAPTVGTEYTFDMSTWSSLANGSHTAVIQAQNVNGGQGLRTYTFTKLYNHLEFKTEADETDAAAEGIICNMAYVGAGINVKVCNNAYDDAPTWEDMTEDFLAKREHNFTNTTKTGTKWGIQFHVTITKSSTVKDVSCTTFQYAYR